MLSTLILLTLSINLSSLITFAPLPLGLQILGFTLTVTIILSTITSSWLPMVTFLIYIGGLMVMFAYFLAIHPNQYMSFSTICYTQIISITMLSISLPTLLMTQNFSTSMLNIMFLTTNYNAFIALLLISILFYMLVISVKITTPKFGPMRPFK